jgi:hypothetical protein
MALRAPTDTIEKLRQGDLEIAGGGVDGRLRESVD